MNIPVAVLSFRLLMYMVNTTAFTIKARLMMPDNKDFCIINTCQNSCTEKMLKRAR